MSDLWCLLPHEIAGASGPAAKVKESSLGRPDTPLLCPHFLDLPNRGKLAGVYVAGHVMEKSNLQSFTKGILIQPHLLILYLPGHPML